MQASGSLSKSQFLALESCFLFLRTVRLSLLAFGNGMDSERIKSIEAHARLAEVNEQRLIRVFPEIAEVAARWVKL